jgi:DNA replication protein DnaC
LDNTFDNFKKKEGTEKSLELFKLYAEGMLGTPFLVCIGDYGCGKTHLMEALVIKRHELGYFCRVTKFNKFIENLKKSVGSQEFPTYDQILSSHCTGKILVMDDIGMGIKETSWLTSVLETLIDSRYYNRLETVLSMNKEAWASLPQRVVSRLCDGEVCTIVENNGKDYRKTK